MTVSMPEAPNKSGAILQAAREEMNLSLEQVANELHLRPSVVKAIEDENYSEFSSDVFLKGYFRTYCRLVNLHEERMMDLLDQQLLFRKKEAEDKEQKAYKLVLAKKRKRLFITFLVFFVSLSLVAFAYQMATQELAVKNNDAASVPSTEQMSVDKVINHDETISSETKNNKQDTATAEKPIDESIKANKVTIDAVKKIELQAVNITSKNINSEALKQPLLEMPLKDSEKIEEAISSQTTQQDSLNTESVLNASFTGNCWFKVTDGAGKTVIAALKKKGSVSNFTGLSPFHVIIGDASKVSMKFDNKPVNLNPYTARNGRAELILKPSDSGSEG